MDLRRLCNVVYAHLTRGMDAKGVALLDATLEGRGPRPQGGAQPRPTPPDQAGMRDLMRAMTMPQKA